MELHTASNKIILFKIKISTKQYIEHRNITKLYWLETCFYKNIYFYFYN